MSVDKAERSESLGVFDVAPYRPDGGLNLAVSLQLTGILGLIGIVLGVVASFVARYFWFVAVFPILIGCVIGGAGSVCIKRFHIRHAAFCGLAGLLAGILAMLAMHYFDLQNYEATLRANIGPDADKYIEVARNIDAIEQPDSGASPEYLQIAAELRNDPLSLQYLQIDTLQEFLDAQAEEGVEIGRGARGGGNINLGYYGSYIYWLLEACLVGGFAFGIMRGSASEPYGSTCMQWKPQGVPGLYAHPEAVVAALQTGRLERFAITDLVDQPVARITHFPCATCGDEAPVDVTVEQLTRNKKGEVAIKKLAKLTFPAGSLEALTTAFELHAPAPAVPTPQQDDELPEADVIDDD